MADKDYIVTASLVIGLFLFGYILGKIDLRNALGLIHFSWLYASIFLFAQMARILSFTLSWKFILKSQGINLGLFKLFNYRLADYTISFLTPGPKVGGEFTRSSLMEKNDGVDYSKALSSCTIDKTIEAFSNSVQLLLGVLLISIFVSMAIGWKILLIFLSIVFFSLVVLIGYGLAKKSMVHSVFKFFRLHRTGLRRFEKDILNFERHMKDYYRSDRRDFYLSFISTIPSWFLSIIEFKYLLLMLGVDMPLAELFLVYNLVGAISVIPVPLYLGTLEAGQISIFALLGRDTNVGVLVALLTRIRDLIISGIGLAVIAFYGLKIKEAFKKYVKNS